MQDRGQGSNKDGIDESELQTLSTKNQNGQQNIMPGSIYHANSSQHKKNRRSDLIGVDDQDPYSILKHIEGPMVPGDAGAADLEAERREKVQRENR